MHLNTSQPNLDENTKVREIRKITAKFRDRAEGGAGGGFSPPTFLQE